MEAVRDEVELWNEQLSLLCNAEGGRILSDAQVVVRHGKRVWYVKTDDMVVLDGFSTFVNALLLVSGLLGVGLAYGYLQRMGIERGEYYVLLLFSVTGMMLMAQATDLIVVFLALELLSIPLYVLAAFARPREESEEAGLKYFLLGAFSTGFVVYGIVLIFGATGSTSGAGARCSSCSPTATRRARAWSPSWAPTW